MRRNWDPEPTPERAAIEIGMDLKRVKNDLRSALARWPHDPRLRALAHQLGVKV